ncbi:MAG TPA: ATPase domain-containing protein [Gemmatimonadales bacterium]|jgi:circadian clock protein KaiC
MPTSPRPSPPSEASAPDKLSTGIPGLDDVMAGGFPPRHLYVVEGEPGTGKTTLGLQFLLEGVRQGERGLYVTLSETKQELLEVATTHGWSLDGIELFELVPPEEALRPEGQYTVFDPSEIELTATTQAIYETVERLNPVRVVLDSLSEMRLLARDPLRYRRQILGLKLFFASRRSTVLLMDDRGGESDLQLRSLAHGVIWLEQLAFEYGAERRRLRVSKIRGVRYRGGYHDYTIRTGGLVVFPRLVAAEHHAPFAHVSVSSGVPELDTLLGGGVDQGTSSLIVGPAGSGKTVLASQYACAAARRGDKVAVYLFDERLGTFLARSNRLGMDFERHMRDGRIRVRQLDPAEISPGEFAHMVVHSTQHEGTGIVVIDSLNGYMTAMPEERLVNIRLHELLSYLAQRGVTTLLTLAQHGVFSEMAEDQPGVSYIADALIVLRFFEAAGEVRKAISVLKKRSGHHEQTIREFQITDKGVRVGQPLHTFQGVLTGVPTYIGQSQPLLPPDPI